MGKDNQTNEIDRCIKLARAVGLLQTRICVKMKINSEQKARIHDQCILPVLTYGAETWIFTQEILHKLKVAQRAIDRKLVGVTLRDRKEMSG